MEAGIHPLNIIITIVIISAYAILLFKAVSRALVKNFESLNFSWRFLSYFPRSSDACHYR